MYSIENSHLIQSHIDELESCEAKILKSSLGLSHSSYSTNLFNAIAIDFGTK